MTEQGRAKAKSSSPARPAGGPAKKAPAKKAPASPAAQKAAAQKAPAKKTAVQKSPAKKTPAKAPAKKTPAKTTAVANAPAKKAPAKVTPAKAEVAKSAHKSRFFSRSQSRAARILKGNPEQLARLAEQAEDHSKKMRSGPMSKFVTELRALLRLIRAYARNDYRDVSWDSMVLIVAAVLYVVSPIDAIPDIVPVAGYMDDAVVLAFVLNLAREEIDAFLAWERANAAQS